MRRADSCGVQPIARRAIQDSTQSPSAVPPNTPTIAAGSSAIAQPHRQIREPDEQRDAAACENQHERRIRGHKRQRRPFDLHDPEGEIDEQRCRYDRNELRHGGKIPAVATAGDK